MQNKIPKVKDKYNTLDSYEEYLKISPSPLGKKEYVDILNKFFKFIMGLIFKGQHIKLPQRMGEILIRGTKQNPRVEDGIIKGCAPDWVKTKELWAKDPQAKLDKKILYNFNEHTNGIRYKIAWVKKNIITDNKSFYSLVFTRANKRNTHREILTGREYIVKEINTFV